MKEHTKECRWERTTEAECEYRATHYYCPHPSHGCDCDGVRFNSDQINAGIAALSPMSDEHRSDVAERASQIIAEKRGTPLTDDMTWWATAALTYEHMLRKLEGRTEPTQQGAPYSIDEIHAARTRLRNWMEGLFSTPYTSGQVQLIDALETLVHVALGSPPPSSGERRDATATPSDEEHSDTCALLSSGTDFREACTCGADARFVAGIRGERRDEVTPKCHFCNLDRAAHDGGAMGHFFAIAPRSVPETTGREAKDG